MSKGQNNILNLDNMNGTMKLIFNQSLYLERRWRLITILC